MTPLFAPLVLVQTVAVYYAMDCALARVELRRLLRFIDSRYSARRHPSMDAAFVDLAPRLVAALRALDLKRRANCLPRALAIYYMGRRLGVPVALSIGVKTKPFAAHSWVSLGSAVISDAREEAARYVPVYSSDGHNWR